MDSDIEIFARWVELGLKKAGKNQDGLGAALGRDRTVVSKIISKKRLIKAHEIERVADYLEEPPPNRMMPVRFHIGAGQEVVPIDGDEPTDYVPVAGFWGIDADLAVVTGDSMWPLLTAGSRLFIGEGRPPHMEDHRQMRAVTLVDGRVFVKIMRRTADMSRWTLESLNAPPIEDVEVEKVGVILRIEPRT